MKKQFLVCLLFSIILFLFGCISPPCWAFHNIPLSIDGSRSLSMGGAFVSILDAENVVSYNPAGLGFNEKPELFLDTISQFNSWPGGRPFDYINIQISAGVAYKNLGVGISAKKIFFCVPGLYTEDITEMVPIISYGIKLNKWLSLGLRCKINNISNSSPYNINNISEGPSLDAGLIYMPIEALSIGLMCPNLLSIPGRYFIRDDWTSIIYPDDKSLPQNLNVGFSFKFPYPVLVSFDIHNFIEYSLSIEKGFKPPYELKRSYHLGIEIPILNFLVIRMGGLYEKYPHLFSLVSNGAYLYQDSYLVTGGIELKLGNIKLDASFGEEFKEELTPNEKTSTWYLSVHGSWIFKDFILEKK